MASLIKAQHLALEVELEKQVKLDGLVDLVLKEDLKCFVALTLDLLHKDVLR